MANYVGSGRSNYFLVKDEAAFRTFMSPFALNVWEHQSEPNVFAFGMTSEDGAFPSDYYDEETDTHIEVDFLAVFREHLADGEVCVFTHSGAEGLRFVSAQALAFNNNPDDDVVIVDLEEIYERARDAFGEEAKITQATY